jgi:arylsulfatase A-like enzyme
LASADRAVRRVLDTLRDTRQDADTYVIFLSDNGYLLGEHRLPGKKGLPYEPASRLPLLISGPGVPSGNTWTSATGMHDIAPTILDMTGTPSSFPMDGQSVLASAGRPDGNPDRAVLLEQADLPIDAENDGAMPRRARSRTSPGSTAGLSATDGNSSPGTSASPTSCTTLRATRTS